MTHSTNYNLNLIEDTDLLDYAPFNENTNIIDTQLKANADAVAGLPTMQAAIESNSTAITVLTNRMGTVETATANNTSAISDLNTDKTAQWTAINTNTANNAANATAIEGLETKEGYILQNVSGNIVTNPTIKGKITYLSSIDIGYDDNIYVSIPSSAIPDSISGYSNFYVNASIHNRQNAGGPGYIPYCFCNAAFGSGGSLTLTFKKIDTIEETIPAAELINAVVYAEIIFI